MAKQSTVINMCFQVITTICKNNKRRRMDAKKFIEKHFFQRKYEESTLRVHTNSNLQFIC